MRSLGSRAPHSTAQSPLPRRHYKQRKAADVSDGDGKISCCASTLLVQWRRLQEPGLGMDAHGRCSRKDFETCGREPGEANLRHRSKIATSIVVGHFARWACLDGRRLASGFWRPDATTSPQNVGPAMAESCSIEPFCSICSFF